MNPKRPGNLLRACSYLVVASLVAPIPRARGEEPVAAVAAAVAAEEGSCPVDFAEMVKPGPSASMMALTQQREDLLRHFFPEGETHRLADGTDLFVPAATPEAREHLAGAVDDLLRQEVKRGLRPAKTVEDFHKWLGGQPFPTPAHIPAGSTLGQYVDQLILKSIVETHHDPKSLLEALKGNLPKLPMKAASFILRQSKALTLGTLSFLLTAVGYNTLGGIGGSFFSVLTDPIQDWAGKRSAEILAKPQEMIQNFITGNGDTDDDDDDSGGGKKGAKSAKGDAKKSDDDDGDDDDDSSSVTQQASAPVLSKQDKKDLRNAKPEIAAFAKKTNELVQSFKDGSLTDEERTKLWKQFGARFYKLNFKLNKTLQDNVSSGRGAFDGSVNSAPIGFAANIATFETNYDMHRRNVKELQAKIAAFNPAKNKDDTPDRMKRLQQDLKDHQAGMDRSKKGIAQVLASWEIHRFIFPEMSDSSKPEAAGEEAFSSSFDTVSHELGIDDMASRYREEVVAALNSYDSRLKLLQKLAYGKMTDPVVK